MIVCICHRVSDRDIARAVQDGCASFEELQFELSVATGCGKCHDCAHETFKRHAGSGSLAPLQATGAPPARPGRVIPIVALRQASFVSNAAP